jgi:hypothetical protein
LQGTKSVLRPCTLKQLGHSTYQPKATRYVPSDSHSAPRGLHTLPLRPLLRHYIITISIYCYYSTITKQCSFLVLQHVKQETSLFQRSSGCLQATKIVLGRDLSLIPSNSLSATKLASAESRALATRPY